jgi:aryl-alcohol dehydrogenase-like predicted oxidoreductase
VQTSRIGLGLAAIGRPAYITTGRDADLGGVRSVDELRARAHEVLDAAYVLGIRYVDTARSYGRGEEFVASWLVERSPEGAEVGSKWGYRYVGDWRLDADVHEVKDHSVAAFREQLAETRRLLGDRLDVYHVHSAVLETGVLDDDELHTELARLRDSGVRVGVSTSGPRQAEVVRRALAVHVGGEPLFTSVQATWNLLEPSVGPALAEAADAGARVLVKEVVANGRLTPAGDPADDAAARVAAVATSLGVPVDQLAYAAALAQPWAWRVLSGAATVGQLRSHVAAESLALPAGAVDALASLAEPPPAYWAARSARAWA